VRRQLCPGAMAGPLALSPSAAPQCTHFGAERQPLISVDAALADPDGVIAIAARHSYRPIGPHYPGVRAPVPERVAMELVEPLAPLLVDIFALAEPPRYLECYLSLVTVAGGDLAPIQRLPHFDGLEPDRIAVLLYLDRRERGGTAFYRQRATGFESVDAGRLDAYRSALEAGVAAHGLPPPGYIAGDTPLFQQTREVAGRFNRLIVYRGNTLHCAALGADFAPVADPGQGRLTLNLFLRAA
jgi:hypothetical protein